MILMMFKVEGYWNTYNFISFLEEIIFFCQFLSIVSILLFSFITEPTNTVLAGSLTKQGTPLPAEKDIESLLEA